MTTIFLVTIALSLAAIVLSAGVLFRLSRMDLELRSMELRVDHMLADVNQRARERAARLGSE